MHPYLHLYTDPDGTINSCVWSGLDEDNAYYRFLSYARNNDHIIVDYDNAINIRRIVEPIKDDIVQIAQGRDSSRKKIFIALYRASHYTLPALIISESYPTAKRAFQDNFVSESHPAILLKLQDATCNFSNLVSRYAADLGWIPKSKPNQLINHVPA